MIERITELLRACGNGQSHFPPTVFYCENWMVRLVADWIVRHPQNPILPVLDRARWYPEGLLASAFLPRYRGDQLAEGFTHADAVIGHFTFGSTERGDVVLLPDVQQFSVIEAKMFSPLSAGTRRAPEFDQAARNVACMAELLRRARRRPSDLQSLNFTVMAPRSRIEEGVFAVAMPKDSIRQKVTTRVAAYDGQRQEWLQTWFLPALEVIHLGVVSWEDVLDAIHSAEPEYAASLRDYYCGCLKWNSLAVPPQTAATSLVS